MTLQELWQGYLEHNVIQDMETPGEVALQKTAFICGVLVTLGTLERGDDVDLGDWREILREALVQVSLECDKHEFELKPSAN